MGLCMKMDRAPGDAGERNFLARFGGSASAASAASPHPVRVRLTHACPILRIGIAAILAAQPGFDVVDAAAPAHPDEDCIVITDYAAGMQAVRHAASAKVLIVTNREKEWDVRHAVDHGVHGYLLQHCPPEELIQSVHMLSRGMGYLGAALKRSVVDSLGRAALTRRERDVLRLLARGDSDKAIADELGIGVVTVKTHVTHLLQKLDATARTHAVVVAMQRGLLPNERDETPLP